MWSDKSIDETVKLLNTNIKSGLNSAEVENRILKYGKNTLSNEKSKSIARIFIEQFNDILIYILIGASAISFYLKEFSDGILIIVVILLNAIIGTIQEGKAEKALDELKKLTSPKASVKRNGSVSEISSEDIVPGDIVILNAGYFVPCDLRLSESFNLNIDESSLTGESVPSSKNSQKIFQDKHTALGDMKNMAFMSTVVTNGRGEGIAVNTGMSSEIGKIADLIEKSGSEKTPLQKKLAKLDKFIGKAAIAACALIFLIGVLEKRDIFDMFLTSIALAVAAIPESLPVIITIVLSLGIQRMIKKNAIVRKLPAVETLGSVNVICSDKTGTLTQNKMTVKKFYYNEKSYKSEDIKILDNRCNLLTYSLILCNDAEVNGDVKTGDPTEIALIDFGLLKGISKLEIQKNYKRVYEIPFDSERKLMTTVNEHDGSFFIFTKGACDILLSKCNNILKDGTETELTNEIKSSIMKSVNIMADKALRVLACAYKKTDDYKSGIGKLEENLTFIGFVGMIDPPRIEVRDSIDICKNSGIRVIMITGDHKNTACAIAKELGISSSTSEAITGSELNSMTQKELNSKIENYKVFSRVSPEHKVMIVNAFKSKGYIVSMTGDGVNDAPALKAADIGVSMGITGTDVAKGASDIILTDDNFSTIVEAVKEGRTIFNNIKKAVIFLLSCNFGELFTIFIAILFNMKSPLTPIHILWINLITDTLPALALGVDTENNDIMKTREEHGSKNILEKKDYIFILLNGLLFSAITLYAAKLGSYYTKIPYYANTMAFLVLSISQLVYAFSLRSDKNILFKTGVFSNVYLYVSLISGIAIQLILIEIPFFRNAFKLVQINSEDMTTSILLCISPFIVNELYKLYKLKL